MAAHAVLALRDAGFGGEAALRLTVGYVELAFPGVAVMISSGSGRMH